MKNLLCLGLLTCGSMFAGTKLHFDIAVHGKQFTLEETFEGTSTTFSQTQGDLTFSVACAEVEPNTLNCDVTISEKHKVIAHTVLHAKFGTNAAVTIHNPHEDISIQLLAHKEGILDVLEPIFH